MPWINNMSGLNPINLLIFAFTLILWLDQNRHFSLLIVIDLGGRNITTFKQKGAPLLSKLRDYFMSSLESCLPLLGILYLPTCVSFGCRAFPGSMTWVVVAHFLYPFLPWKNRGTLRPWINNHHLSANLASSVTRDQQNLGVFFL